MSGMFTSSSPETRRVIPKKDAGSTRFKIVYVVLESQYQAFTEADMTNLKNIGYLKDATELEEGVKQYLSFLNS